MFVPDEDARSWHLGRTTLMQQQDEVNRYNRPFVTDRVPDLRHWRTKGRGLHRAVGRRRGRRARRHAGGGAALRRRAAHRLLRRHRGGALVGPWSSLGDDRRSPLGDPDRELRLVQAEYVGEGRVRFVEEVPGSGVPGAVPPAAAGRWGHRARGASPASRARCPSSTGGLARCCSPTARSPGSSAPRRSPAPLAWSGAARTSTTRWTRCRAPGGSTVSRRASPGTRTHRRRRGPRSRSPADQGPRRARRDESLDPEDEHPGAERLGEKPKRSLRRSLAAADRARMTDVAAGRREQVVVGIGDGAAGFSADSLAGHERGGRQAGWPRHPGHGPQHRPAAPGHARRAPAPADPRRRANRRLRAGHRLHAPRRGEALRGPRLPPDHRAGQPARLALGVLQRARAWCWPSSGCSAWRCRSERCGCARCSPS